MLRTRTLAVAIAGALALGTVVKAEAAPFDNIFVFGDSLSDNGDLSLALGYPRSRFTTNPGTVAIENIASYYGLALNPSVLGGGDFAFGGAGIINNSPGTPSSVPLLPMQLAQYLAASGGKADPNALYSVWGGANDIFYNAYVAGIGGQTPAQAQAAIIAAAQGEIGMLAQLQGAGARYVLVFNLPNIGLTPSGTAQGPAGSAALTGLSVTFNSALNTGLAQYSGPLNIIPVNAFAVLNEIMANPQAYGFTNVTTPACGANSSSLQCGPAGSGAPYTYAAGTQNTYLFADGVHPTTAAHAALAQYVESIINAPGQQSLLAEAPLALYDAHQRAIDGQLMADGSRSAPSGVRFFANYDYAHQRFDAGSNNPRASANDSVLTLGADARASDALSVGFALGVANQNVGDSGAGGFKTQDLLLSGYGAYRMDNFWVSGSASFGTLNLNQITRSFQIGAALRSESGKTAGSQTAFNVSGGYWFDLGGFRTGPLLSLTRQQVKINGYNENGSDSSAMYFGRIRRTSTVGQLGWQLEGRYDMGDTSLRPFASVAYAHDADANPINVSAGLLTMAGSFTLPGFTPSRNWYTASLGVMARFSPTLTGYVAYNGRFNDSSQKINALNLGVQFAF